MEKQIILTLHINEVKYLRNLIGKQPLDEVLGLVTKIEQQANGQLMQKTSEEKPKTDVQYIKEDSSKAETKAEEKEKKE